MNTVIYLASRGQVHLDRRDFDAAIADFETALDVVDYPAVRQLLEEALDRRRQPVAPGAHEGAAEHTAGPGLEAHDAVEPHALVLHPTVHGEIHDPLEPALDGRAQFLRQSLDDAIHGRSLSKNRGDSGTIPACPRNTC